MKISEEALALIKEFEGCDLRPSWPEGMSGVTIGYGYDLGYEPHFLEDWGPHITREVFTALKPVLGVKGSAARIAARTVRNIILPREACEAVLVARTIPSYEAQTLKAFPGADALGPDTFGSLVSLVYNRGASLAGSRRSHMMNIRGLVRADLEPCDKRRAIAAQIRSMVSIWEGTSIERGMRRRRTAEANLCEGKPWRE